MLRLTKDATLLSAIYFFITAFLNELPDLVVYLILKYLRYPCNKEEDFKQRLPFLAINRNFRQTGLPSVYNCLSIDVAICFAIEDPKDRLVSLGTYSLYRTSGLRHLVRKMKFGGKDTFASLDDFQILIQEFMENLVAPKLTVDIMLREYIKLFPNVSEVSISTSKPGDNGNMFVNG